MKPNLTILAALLAPQIFAQSTGTLLQVDFNNTVTWPEKGTPEESQKLSYIEVRGLPNILGVGDVVADPQFVNPTDDPAVADFHPKPGSPAIKGGRWELFSPATGSDLPAARAAANQARAFANEKMAAMIAAIS